MTMRKSIMKPVVATAFSALLVFELAGCGTIIYPERRGQAGGKIDPAVVIMDGIGLLFWVIPGLVAFAVDFATGAIYSPSGRFSVAPEVLKPAINEAGRLIQYSCRKSLSNRQGATCHLIILISSSKTAHLSCSVSSTSYLALK